ncbi:MAG TPA: PEP-CTERM sorting domain-containing protein [Tepidisphaeraceae bacterium]|nr:PEP-CTERM sorting domain-containing protein [Tepidisphaeraceae bacterium]
MSRLGTNVGNTYQAGSTGINTTQFQSFLGTGYYDAPSGDSGGGVYNEYGLRTLGGNGEVRDYFGFSGFGSSANARGGTAYMVIRPKDGFTSGTRALMGTGYNFGATTSTGALRLYSSGGAGNPLVFEAGMGEQPNRSGLYGGAVDTDINGDGDVGDWVIASTSATTSWDSDSWYFIGASWQGGQAPVLYLRELSEGSVAAIGQAAAAGGNVVAGIPSVTGNVDPGAGAFVLGAYPVDSGGGPRMRNAALAQFAYARLDNTFSSTADMAAVYESLVVAVPEPSSLAIGAVAAGLLLRRRRDAVASFDCPHVTSPARSA